MKCSNKLSFQFLKKYDEATVYANKVINNKIIVCEKEKLACQRHLNDLKKQGTKSFPFIYDITRVKRIIDFFEKYLCHVKGIFAGTPILLDDWQKFDLSIIFGWVDMNTGARRFSKSFQEVARGNAKSTIMSGIVLYGGSADCIYPPFQPELKKFEMNPEIECCAYDREQAKIVWLSASRMAENSPKISKQLNIKKTYIENKKRGGHIRALSKDTKNKDGLSTCIAVADEIHVWKTSEIMDVILSGFGKRSQSLFCIITTAGNNAENSVGKNEYDICTKILEGTLIDESYFVMIREIDEEDNPYDEKVWVKANPILRSDSDYARQLKTEIKKASNTAQHSGDPAKRREFLTKRCNRWQVGSEDKYFTTEMMTKWKSLAVSQKELRDLIQDKDCIVGLDLSKSIDLTGFGAVFHLNDGKIAIKSHGFIPKNSATKHEQSDRIHYTEYTKQGHCSLIDGDVIDDRDIVEYIKEFCNEYNTNILEVGIDPYSSRFISGLLQDEGLKTVQISQNFITLSQATKLFREMVMKGEIVHDGNPLLTWCISNACQIIDTNENIRLNKKSKSDTQRIDLIASVINALVRLPALKDSTSIYEMQGVRCL